MDRLYSAYYVIIILYDVLNYNRRGQCSAEIALAKLLKINFPYACSRVVIHLEGTEAEYSSKLTAATRYSRHVCERPYYIIHMGITTES